MSMCFIVSTFLFFVLRCHSSISNSSQAQEENTSGVKTVRLHDPHLDRLHFRRHFRRQIQLTHVNSNLYSITPTPLLSNTVLVPKVILTAYGFSSHHI